MALRDESGASIGGAAKTMIEYNKLDQLKLKLDSFRPLPPEAVGNLHADFTLRWTYHSNAIEGNSLTLMETKVVLEGITIGGKTLREHLEVVNHHAAISLMEKIVKENQSLTETDIKAIHQMVLKEIDNANAGVYRSVNVIIGGARHFPPAHEQVPVKMAQFIEWYQSAALELHPIERAARVHADFVKMHPFIDGNGRTSRLLMNLELMKGGFPPVIIPVEKRLEYYDALDLSCTENNYSAFVKMVADAAEQAFEPYWYALNIKPDKGVAR